MLGNNCLAEMDCIALRHTQLGYPASHRAGTKKRPDLNHAGNSLDVPVAALRGTVSQSVKLPGQFVGPPLCVWRVAAVAVVKPQVLDIDGLGLRK
jgi:hypothetical protein